jgi:hypothetical protein
MRTITILLSAVLCLPAAFAAEGTFPVEDGFLSVDLDQLTVVEEKDGGIDLVYRPPGVFDRLAKYNKLMIDQPEVWLDPDSEYRGVKPDNLKAIADLIRERLTERVISRGYEVVDEPGPGVLYMRVALTDLYLKKEKRGILGYTPIGAVVKLGADAVRDMLSKVDIIEMALQVEFLDSQSEEVLGAIVIKRGARKDKKAGQKEQRMDFDEFRSILREYGARMACRLDNAKMPESQQIDCANNDALETAGYLDLSE